MHLPKKTHIYFCIIISFFLLPTSQTRAFDFNPNNIISDADLQDYHSMGRDEIRSFLTQKNSTLTDLILEDFEGKQRYASEIIYRAARNYQISPKYLLVKLQKEQSLVTAPSPTQRQFDWATGYGACDSCDTTDPALNKYKGFGKQVDAAAGIMRWYYDHMGTENWIKKPQVTYSIDNTEVTPANAATAFLYTYTPHLHGNENFGRLWSAWFSQTYPEGTLFKSKSNPAVYVLSNGMKRPIQSMAVLLSRYNPKLIVTISDDELTD